MLLLNHLVETWNYMMTLLVVMFGSMRIQPANEPDTASEADDPVLRLTYFDAKGIAEAIRITCSFTGLSFDDERLNKEEFDERKDSFPFKQVPVLEVEDADGTTQIAQSKTILRYVSKLGRTYSTKNHLNAALVDQWCDLHTDCMWPIVMNMYPQRFGLPEDFDKTAHRKWCIDEHIPKYLHLLESELMKSYETWLANMDQLSMADICWYATLSSWREGVLDGMTASSFDEFPNVKKYLIDVRSQIEDDDAKENVVETDNGLTADGEIDADTTGDEAGSDDANKETTSKKTSEIRPRRGLRNRRVEEKGGTPTREFFCS